MTRFTYAEYIALFRSSDTKRNSPQKSSSSSSSGQEEPIEPSVAVDSDSTSDGWTALHEAAHCGHIHGLQALLRDRHLCVDKRTLQEQTALMLAVLGRHLECVKILLDAGADPDISNKQKETPLYTACEQECVGAVKLLLGSGAAVNQRCRRGWTALHAAARRDHIEICHTLLQDRAAIDARNADGVTPAIEAARHGNTKTLAYLIQNGAGVDLQTSNGNTALSEACRHGHVETVRLLLKHHADANRASDDGLLPLHVASQHGHHEMVSLLLPVTSRLRIRQSGISPLHLVAEHGHLSVMRLLLESGLDVNSRLSDKRSSAFRDGRVTPLYAAVAAGHTRAIAVLLEAGATPDLDPISPLLLAARQGHSEAVALLLESGAHANTCPPGHTATFPAALLYAHQPDVLQLLLDHGCDAQACFTCDTQHRQEDAHLRNHTDTSQRHEICTAPQQKFCDWICSSGWTRSAGHLVDLLLEYVGNVQLCSRITELLRDEHEWPAIREKTSSPRALMHLCRLKIRECVGTQRLRSVHSLPLPAPLLQYLTSRSGSDPDKSLCFRQHTPTPASTCI